jgi:murein peptide amidase A
MKLRLGGAFTLALVAILSVAAISSSRPADPVGRRSLALGDSVDGRPITAIETGDFDSPQHALVVGCIHGNECAGIPVAERLAHAAPPREVDLWIVPNLNPDGAAAGTRGNAHGVDLNRNFPWRWTRLSGIFDSGPYPLSEPESRLAYRLIERARPAVSIWFHQHLNLVDDSSGSKVLERRFAAAARLRLALLAQEPGSAVTWQNHCFPHSTAFVVELPAGPLPRAGVFRLEQAVRITLATDGGGKPVHVAEADRRASNSVCKRSSP